VLLKREKHEIIQIVNFKAKKTSFFVVAVLFAAIFGATASYSDAPIIDQDDGWALPNSTGIIGSQSAWFTESTGQNFSMLTDSFKSSLAGDPTCKSTNDDTCNFSKFNFSALIPVCQSVSDQNCIEGMGGIDKNGKDYPGIFQSYFPAKAQNQFAGEPNWNLPSGGSGSLFRIAGASGIAGDTYYVSLLMSGNGGIGITPKVTLTSLAASITPVQLQNIEKTITDSKRWCTNAEKICDDGWNYIDAGQSGNPRWGISINGGADGIHNCVTTSWRENSCAQKEPFPNGFKFYLKARFSLPPTGWLHGRMSNPEISLTQKNGITEILVTAAPVAVPMVFKTYLWRDMPLELQSLYDPGTGNYRLGNDGNGSGFGRTVFSNDPLQRAVTVAPFPHYQSAIPQLTAWLPFVNDSASALPHYWSFRTLSQSELKGANNCFTDPEQLNGIVTTNSTAYSPGPPSYDSSAGDLNYKLAAPHFTNKNEIFYGTYDLVMQSKVARCIYGFSTAPIKASISVISASGSPQVATTVVGEKDGWLHLSANGFEFSSPTVAVNLSQDAPAQEVTPTPTPTSNVEVKKIINKVMLTCIKGKKVKTLTAVAPHCPSGYKIKK
jgi:hypothetical protein